MKKILTIIYIWVVVLVSILLFTLSSSAQQNPGTNTKKVAANTQYDKASGFKRLMLGDHYRKEWGTAVDVIILDMDNAAGGLTPVKMGGGLQTKSLRLKGANGKEYVLRSVNKDPSKALVAELQDTFAEDIVQDQISSANPYAPMVVAALAKSTGIFHTTPQLVWVPKSPKLGEFTEAFAETLCLFEERPSGNEENNPAYGFSKSIVSSEKMLEKVFSSSDHVVNQKAFLKARLFDMLIGDWDRHEDQWLWASFKKDGQTVYHPIPRDRDQAFSKMDGIIPQIATKKWAIRKIQDFDYQIKDINGLNTNGMHLDRNFTTQLTLGEWLLVADELQDALTDNVIAAAFREMPDVIYNISGKETVAKLKRRRDDLEKYAKAYYEFLSEQVNITGTKNKELFEVTRLNNDSTLVIVYNDEPKNKVIYQRTFLRSETKEIRLYGLEGNDIFNIDGSVNKGITVRVIGGKGEDNITDNSEVKGLSKQTKVYDDATNTVTASKETKTVISSDPLKNEYNRKSFRFDWLAPTINPGYNPEDGMYIGGGVVYKKQQFGKTPFGYMQSFAANYAFKTGAYTLWYKGIFREVIGKTDLQIGAGYTSSAYNRNYYGLGNETIQIEDAPKDYYRVKLSQFTLSSTLHRQLGSKHTISFESEFQSIKLDENDGRYVSSVNSKTDSSVFGRKKYMKIHLNYQFNTLDNNLFPTKGVKWNSGIAFTQNLNESEKYYSQVFSEASFYTTKGPVTIASRTGFASNLSDDYEFFQANTLGGLTNLRGYRRERFAGKTSVYQNTEIRVGVSYFNAYMVKGVWGVLGFLDNGRVWMPEEKSDEWHRSYGGGVWFFVLDKMVLTATYGVSKEDKLINIKAGFLF